MCERIATTKDSLRKICMSEMMPSVNTVLRWLREKEDFRAQYVRAKEEQADFLAEEMLEIADDDTDDILETEQGKSGNPVSVQRARLRVDARKWAASKLKPKKYGDKMDVTSDGQKIDYGKIVIENKVQGDEPEVS